MKPAARACQYCLLQLWSVFFVAFAVAVGLKIRYSFSRHYEARGKGSDWRDSLNRQFADEMRMRALISP